MSECDRTNGEENETKTKAKGGRKHLRLRFQRKECEWVGLLFYYFFFVFGLFTRIISPFLPFGPFVPPKKPPKKGETSAACEKEERERECCAPGSSHTPTLLGEGGIYKNKHKDKP